MKLTMTKTYQPTDSKRELLFCSFRLPPGSTCMIAIYLADGVSSKLLAFIKAYYSKNTARIPVYSKQTSTFDLKAASFHPSCSTTSYIRPWIRLLTVTQAFN